MALDNKLRVSELVQSGSRAIISEDSNYKNAYVFGWWYYFRI